jgi:RHS repeat-associated protein
MRRVVTVLLLLLGLVPTTLAAAPASTYASFDADTDLARSYFGARYYASRTGRFTTVDPAHVNGNIFDPQSWNAYAYTRNNPLRFVDPTGTEYVVCASGGGCNSVRDYEWESALENLGSNFSVQGNNILAWVSGRWQPGAYFYWHPDRPRDFNGMVRTAGDL